MREDLITLWRLFFLVGNVGFVFMVFVVLLDSLDLIGEPVAAYWLSGVPYYFALPCFVSMGFLMIGLILPERKPTQT